MSLSPDFLLELHERNDIVEVIDTYVGLKRRGRLYTALCPFHNEKTPSFTVYPDTQSYYCFGCGAGGDVITFIKQKENLEYIEAVKLLAARAGLAMPDDVNDDAMRRRKRMYEINRLTARFFFDSLNTDAGKHARAYLRGRRLADATIKHFGIGWAPDGWTGLRDCLRARGYSDDELVAAGVCTVSQKNNSVYDFFRDRVMFPVIDVRGNVVAFSGRTMGTDPRKYVNTRDTDVFKKSRTLFALNIAKNNDRRQILVAEGQMDVIALHAAGFTNAVAALGTALTDEHARMISQYADEVVLIYDSDEAGQKATRRAIETFKSTNLNVRVVNIPGAKDPDEFLKNNDAAAFEALLSGADNATEYALVQAKRKYDLKTDAGRVGYLKDAAGVLARLTSATERDIYAGRVAGEIGAKKDSILLETDSLMKRLRAKQTREEDSRLARSVGERFHARDGALGAVSAERSLVALLFRNPDLAKSVAPRLAAEDFISAESGALYAALVGEIEAERFTGFPSLAGVLTAQQISLLSGIVAETQGVNFAPEDADLYIDRILRPRSEPDAQALKTMDAAQLQKLIEEKQKDKETR
ncbi:MAG: DNA primase [Oscillospiraceae bacterium]|nr:DNA primase [Oscillospiraceae bacterium]